MSQLTRSDFVPQLTFTVADEVADDIVIDIASSDPDLGALEYEVVGYEATGIEALVGALTLAETGAGAEVSTTANARLFFTLSSAGVAQITATDAFGASGKTFHLVFRPVGFEGPAQRQAITFD